MQYHGGKARLAPKIAPLIIDAGAGCHTYLEPFIGGCNTFTRVAPHFRRAIGADIHADVVMLWAAAARGWQPPSKLTRQEWHDLRGSAESSPMRAFAGFGCSFGGKWFAGYAPRDETHAAGARNYANGARNGILRKAATIRHAEFLIADMTRHAPGANWLVYCDPPYRNTTPYNGTPRFDADGFIELVEAWTTAGATVLVSEQSAPDHWQTIAEFEQMGSLERRKIEVRAERLYRVVPKVML